MFCPLNLASALNDVDAANLIFIQRLLSAPASGLPAPIRPTTSDPLRRTAGLQYTRQGSKITDHCNVPPPFSLNETPLRDFIPREDETCRGIAPLLIQVSGSERNEC